MQVKRKAPAGAGGRGCLECAYYLKLFMDMRTVKCVGAFRFYGDGKCRRDQSYHRYNDSCHAFVLSEEQGESSMSV